MGQLTKANLMKLIFNSMTENQRTLEQQKEAFKQKKLLASPIAGLIAWLAVAISGLFSLIR
jgi:hypothetical protein